MGFWKKYFGKEKSAPSLEKRVIWNERFGRCTFEKDEEGGPFRLVSPRMPLEKYEDAEIELEVPEERIGEALFYLVKLCDRQEKYLGKFYEGILSFCEEWEETDSEGNEITMKMIEENCRLFQILVKESRKGNLTVSFNGMMFDDKEEDLLGCHSVIAEFDCETGEVEYNLEG